MALQIDKEFLQETARSIYRKADVSFQNESFAPGRDMQHLIRVFMEECMGRQAGYEFILQSLSTLITVNLLRQLKTNLPILLPRRSYSENENINQDIEFLRELSNKKFSLEDVARVANLSPYHFIRVFKAQTGKTPYEYLLDIKIDKAGKC